MPRQKRVTACWGCDGGMRGPEASRKNSCLFVFGPHEREVDGKLEGHSKGSRILVGIGLETTTSPMSFTGDLEKAPQVLSFPVRHSVGAPPS